MLNYSIEVMNAYEAFRYVYDYVNNRKTPNFAIISIRDAEESKMGVKYVPGGNLKDALNINFADIEKTYPKYPDEHLMTLEDATKIKEFVEMLNKKNEIEFLIIHCHAGISRSSATAAAIERVYNGLEAEKKYFDPEKYFPNMHVYEMLLKTFGLEME